jgi:hypothetical protein
VAARVKRPERTVRSVIVVSLVGLIIAGCGPDGGVSLATFPAGSLGPAATVGPAVAQTRGDLVRVLGTRNLVLQDSTAAFRPPEDGRFTLTPRALYQVILPEAPSQGFIVVYEFPDAAAAREAAEVQARYLATGPARVQSPFGTRHILRLVGATVVLYSWVPDGIEDPRQPDIQVALETLGVGVPIPS